MRQFDAGRIDACFPNKSSATALVLHCAAHCGVCTCTCCGAVQFSGRLCDIARFSPCGVPYIGG